MFYSYHKYSSEFTVMHAPANSFINIEPKIMHNLLGYMRHHNSSGKERLQQWPGMMRKVDLKRESQAKSSQPASVLSRQTGCHCTKPKPG